MNAILITLNVVVLSGLAALSFVWPPALFAFLIVGPLSLLSFWWISSGGVSARTIFVSTAILATGALFVGSYLWPMAAFGWVIVGPIVILGLVDMLQTSNTSSSRISTDGPSTARSAPSSTSARRAPGTRSPSAPSSMSTARATSG
jgi:hypothetical protein